MIPVAINNNYLLNFPFVECNQKGLCDHLKLIEPCKEPSHSLSLRQTSTTSSDTFSQAFEKTIKVKDKYIVIVSASLYLIGYIIDNWQTIINALFQ